MHNFDIQRYLGLWYEVQKYPFIFTIGGKCITSNYELNADQTVQIFNRQIKKGQEDTIKGKARIIQPGVGILGVSFPNIPCEFLAIQKIFKLISSFVLVQREANYNVLYTDYDELAVVYSCSSFFGFVNAKVVWILSRTRFPSQYVIEKAHSILEENGLSTTFLSSTDNSKCPDDESILFNTVDSFRN